MMSLNIVDNKCNFNLKGNFYQLSDEEIHQLFNTLNYFMYKRNLRDSKRIKYLENKFKSQNERF